MFLGQSYSVSSRQYCQGRRAEHDSTRPLILQLSILYHKGTKQPKHTLNNFLGHNLSSVNRRHRPQQSVYNLSTWIRCKPRATNTRKLGTWCQRYKRFICVTQIRHCPQHFDDRRNAYCVFRNLQRTFNKNVQRFETVLRACRTQSFSAERNKKAL